MGESAWEIRICPRDLWVDGLRVLYRRTPVGIRESVVRQACEEASRGDLDLSGLWIGGKHGRVNGAILTQLLAGRAAAVWPPEVNLAWNRRRLAEVMVREALAGLRRQGAILAQSLLDSDDGRQAGLDLTRGGMPAITALEYLSRECTPPLAHVGAPELVWKPFSPAVEGEFRAVIDATYDGSLDMPELDGVRSLDDILKGHEATGRFVPERWQIGRVPGEPDAAAILLLSEHSSRSSWEVSYLGLTPAARGRGLGQATLERALTLARAQASRLELAVDVRNVPAIRLYEKAGFTQFDRRIVHLALLG